MLAEWVERLLSYASGALDAIRADESFPAFMQWAHSEGVNYSGGDEALAVALAPVLWSQTPLVRLDFARESLAPPGRNEPCWCDSGRKYKQCCDKVQLPAIPDHLMWMLSLREFKGEQLKAALASGLAPAQALLEAGLISAESGNRGRAQQIMEALFDTSDWSRLPEQAEPGFELLLDLYQERGFTRKKALLLDEVLERGPAFLRGVALEHQCLLHLDSDDLGSARAAFIRAQQTLPDSPTLAYIEAMLLLHEGQPEEAQDRARFWWRRLSKQKDIEPGQLEFLADLAENPRATLAEQMVNSDESLSDSLAALQALFEVIEHPPRLALETQDDGSLLFRQNAEQAVTLGLWEAVFPARIEEEAALALDIDPWDVQDPNEWLQQLCASPEWLDVPAVCQGLILALASRFGSLPWMSDTFFVPLAKRFDRWLDQIEQAGGLLRWEDGDNAQLLRCGLGLVIGMERGERERSRQLAERLLKLDEEDSLGLRELVLDQLLREGRNDEAVTLAEHDIERRAVDEEMPLLGILMGQVLALYRLGRDKDAEQALEIVREANSHLISLLLAEHPRPVSLAVEAPEPGTRGEAWQYRTLMRDQWKRSEGALAWLAKHR